MDYMVFSGPKSSMTDDVLSPLSAQTIFERQLRRGLLIAGMAVYLVVAFCALDMLS